MQKPKSLYLFGGTLALFSGAVLFYIHYEEEKKKKQLLKEKQEFIEKHPIQDVEQALRELKIQLYPLFFSIAKMEKIYIEKEMQKTQGDQEKVKENVHQILKAEFTKMVKQKEKLIYQKYKLNYVTVEQALSNYYSEEPSVQSIYQFILKSIQNCIVGIPPVLQTSEKHLQFATEEKVLNVWKRISINNGKKLLRFYNILKEKGITDLTLENQQVFEGISSLNLTADRDYILELEGFTYLESEDASYKESAMDILQKYCEYYKNKSQQFAEFITRMEDIHENLVMFAMDPSKNLSENDVEMLYDKILV